MDFLSLALDLDIVLDVGPEKLGDEAVLELELADELDLFLDVLPV